MKRVEVSISGNRSESFEKYIFEEDLSFQKYSVLSEDKTVFNYIFYLDDSIVDSSIEEFTRFLDLRYNLDKITIYPVEAFVSRELRDMRNRYKVSKNPIVSLLEEVEPYSRINRDFFAIVALSSLILVAGLFLDNIVIILGATLISPLLEPIKAFNLNLLLGDYKEAWRNERDALILLGSVVLLCGLVTLVVDVLYGVSVSSQILVYGSASVVVIIVSLLIGVCGGLGMFSNIPGSLIGIAVSIALLPPAAVSGIGLALGDVSLFSEALLNLGANFVGLQLGGVVTLRVKGVSSGLSLGKDSPDWPLYFVIFLHILVISVIIFYDLYR